MYGGISKGIMFGMLAGAAVSLMAFPPTQRQMRTLKRGVWRVARSASKVFDDML